MQITYFLQGSTLTLRLIGELDHHSAAEARRLADHVIDLNASAMNAVIDLSEVSFMDSTGIGFLIGRYKRLARYGIPLSLSSPTPATDKVLTLSGVYTLMPKI